MNVDHRSLPQAFAAGGAYVVLSDHIERLGPQVARIVSDAREREHEGRHDDVPDPVGDVPYVFPDSEHALTREEPEGDRHEDDRHQPEPELRYGMPDHAEHADDVVDPAPPP